MTQTAPPEPVASPLVRRAGAIAVTALAVTASVFSSFLYFVMASTVPGTEDNKAVTLNLPQHLL